jgi:hypothetical protein
VRGDDNVGVSEELGDDLVVDAGENWVSPEIVEASVMPPPV